ncbi:hypothetical protein GY45DRAFT_1297230 [Cubamyces sp. BRFM 1775]|nr:hypothetical protein GY45DRAFT_1297230 [Cubamyces sp. BRFM 1775]
MSDHAAPKLLNNDILLNIMQVSDTNTVCSLMQVSRPLYHLGPTCILPPLVFIEDEQRLQSFIAFMTAEEPYRFKFLRRLCIATDSISSPVSELLVDFLTRFKSVMELSLLHIEYAERFIQSHPGLSGALAGLSHITRLFLRDAGKDAGAYCYAMNASLDSASLTLTPLPVGTTEETVWGEQARNPITLLHHAQDTLRSLHVDGTVLDSPEDVMYKPRYSHLTRLCLRNNDLPWVFHYVRAFPNIEELTFQVSKRVWDDITQTPDLVERQSRINAASQTEFGTWTKLRRVTGTLPDLLMLALLCPVEQLVVVGPWFHSTMANPVLESLKPAYLELQDFDVPFIDSGRFADVMAGPEASSIRSLSLDLNIGVEVEPGEIDFARTLDTLVEAISGLLIKTIGLNIGCSCLLFPARYDTSLNNQALVDWYKKHRASPPKVTRYLQDLDLDALAQRFVDAVPSLHTAVVTLTSLPGRRHAVAVANEDNSFTWNTPGVEAIPLKRLRDALRGADSDDQEVRDFAEAMGMDRFLKFAQRRLDTMNTRV